MKAIAPNGLAIVATVETVMGTCGIRSFYKDEKGELCLEYDDQGTEICWDTAEQIKRDGKPVYQDADGFEWTEDELKLIEDDDEDED